MSDQTVTRGSSSVTFIPKRSAASAEVLSLKVTGRPSFFHAVSPPSSTQTFEMPFFRNATATRALETCAQQNAGKLNVHKGKTSIFIFPPAQFQVVDALLTNFHLPESTLLMLVSAFAAPGEKCRGRDLVLSTYAEAVRERYRFFSYGDAMLIL